MNNMIIYCLLIFYAAGHADLYSGSLAQDPLCIGSRLELFVDSYLIDKMDNVRLVLQEPKDEGPVLYFEKPWEGPFCGYSTIIKDGDLYRLYYRGLPLAGKDGSAAETTCYAESKDGLTWHKPNLGIYDVAGTLENNVILADDAPFSHNFSPFLDSNPQRAPKKKFKAVAGTRDTGLFGFISSDGIHWRKVDKNPIFTKGVFDSQNVVFWSDVEQCYVCYFRTWTNNGYSGIRTVSKSTSKDFLHWTDPVQMSFGDTPMEHLYTNQTHPYFRAPHIYVAIAARFMPNRQVLTDEQAKQLKVNPKYFKDCSDAVFMTSRGGYVYDRTFLEGFIRPGIGLENWVSRSNYPVLNVVQTGASEMSVYVNQNYAQPTSHIRRYALRLDGFTSVKAPYEGGELLTKPLIFGDNTLYLNFATSAAGGIRVEIQDVDGEPISGYSLDACRMLIGNEIRKAVVWNVGSDVSSLAGRPVRLRFVLRDADLFSMQLGAK